MLVEWQNAISAGITVVTGLLGLVLRQLYSRNRELEQQVNNIEERVDGRSQERADTLHHRLQALEARVEHVERTAASKDDLHETEVRIREDVSELRRFLMSWKEKGGPTV